MDGMGSSPRVLDVDHDMDRGRDLDLVAYDVAEERDAPHTALDAIARRVADRDAFGPHEQRCALPNLRRIAHLGAKGEPADAQGRRVVGNRLDLAFQDVGLTEEAADEGVGRTL